MYIYICIGGVDSCHLFVIDVFTFYFWKERNDDDDDVKGVQNVSLSLSLFCFDKSTDDVDDNDDDDDEYYYYYYYYCRGGGALSTQKRV